LQPGGDRRRDADPATAVGRGEGFDEEGEVALVDTVA